MNRVTGKIVDSSNATLANLVFTAAPTANFSAVFEFDGSAPSGFPTGYSLNFYKGSTLIATGGLVKGGLTSTPEPQTYAMAAGAALLGFAAFRRARR